MTTSVMKKDDDGVQNEKLAVLIFMVLILSIVVFNLAGGVMFTRSAGVSAYFGAHPEYSTKMQELMKINGIESLYRKDNSGPFGAGSYFEPTWLGAVVNGRGIDCDYDRERVNKYKIDVDDGVLEYSVIMNEKDPTKDTAPEQVMNRVESDINACIRAIQAKQAQANRWK